MLTRLTATVSVQRQPHVFLALPSSYQRFITTRQSDSRASGSSDGKAKKDEAGGGDWEVWRMDTHGTEYLDSTHSSVSAAEGRIRYLEGDVQHKQHYYLRRQKPS